MLCQTRLIAKDGLSLTSAAASCAVSEVLVYVASLRASNGLSTSRYAIGLAPASPALQTRPTFSFLVSRQQSSLGWTRRERQAAVALQAAIVVPRSGEHRGETRSSA